MTVWENRISPVADSAIELLIAEIRNRTILSREHELFRAESLFLKAKRLMDLGVNVFVCGAISNFYATLVEGYGIRIIPFVSGRADEILNAFLLEETWRESGSSDGPTDPGNLVRRQK